MHSPTPGRYRGVAAIQPTGLRTILVVVLAVIGLFLTLFVMG